MVEMDAEHWNKVLQPRIVKETTPYQAVDDYLNASHHEFTEYWKDNYKFRIWFDDPKDEVIFRLRYGIK